MQGIEDAGLTEEQWRAVIGFCSHNFGNLVGCATLALGNARDGNIGCEKIDDAQRHIRVRYRQIIETMKALEDGCNRDRGEIPETGGEAIGRAEQRSEEQREDQARARSDTA